ncbi:MAG: carbohydrate kinase family protein [Clostridia bacterium]|nr:carbohydrate kinase family protein [Clostridia bacterium]
MENNKYIVGVGAANIDQHWRSLAPVNLRDSNPSHCSLTVGGVTRNICENLARLGQNVSLLSAVGDDVYAEMIVRESSRAGIDMSRVQHRAGFRSSSYIAVLDDIGDMLLGLSDMRIINDMPVSYLEENRAFISGASAVVCDGALPRETLDALITLAGDSPCFIDPVSIAYARNMAPLAGKFHCIKPNRFELNEIARMPTGTDLEIELAVEAVLNKGTNCVVVSLGERGCYYADNTGKRFFRNMMPLEEMADATGAGDAFTGGLIYGTVNGMDAEHAVQCALAAGRIAAASPVTVSEEMSVANIMNTIEQYS